MSRAPLRLSVSFLTLACLLAGCGGGTDSSTQSTAAGPSKARLPLKEAIHQGFPKPKPDPEVPGSAKAIAMGEAACKGKTPKQVVHEYAKEAKLTPVQRKALGQIATAEAHPGPDFVAGQLAALAYEGTLGGKAAGDGYRGCVYALAVGMGKR